MSAKEVTESLIEAMKQLPEVRLRLIDLAWQTTKDDGSLDADQLLLMSKELDEAIDEARAYANATRKAVSCLMSFRHSTH